MNWGAEVVAKRSSSREHQEPQTAAVACSSASDVAHARLQLLSCVVSTTTVKASLLPLSAGGWGLSVQDFPFFFQEQNVMRRNLACVCRCCGFSSWASCIFFWRLVLSYAGDNARKTPMKELFGVPKLKKDGTPGNVLVLPPIDEIQTRPDMRKEFIKYSAYDAQV